jgi:predicted porin
MKKTLIALAAVAATSASFAQSTVTLSGTVDVGLQKRFSGDALSMASSRNGTSNWTLSGAEDLGGGLKAVFQISTAFNADDGTLTAANALGNNGMFVGLTGGFGTLRAGRPVNTLYANAMIANGTKGVSLHDSNSVLSGNATATAKTSGASSSVYVPNAVQYHTPRFGGVQVQLEYAPSESTAVGNKAGTGVAVRYDGGPLSVSFTNYTGAKAATSTLKSVNQIAAAYDFSVAKLFFTYRDQGGLASDQDTSYALGVTAPVGPGALYAAYNVNEQTGSDGRTVIGGYKYNLSKRTQAYVNIARRNAAWIGAAVTANGGDGTKSSTGYGFGLQHNF